MQARDQQKPPRMRLSFGKILAYITVSFLGYVSRLLPVRFSQKLFEFDARRWRLEA